MHEVWVTFGYCNRCRFRDSVHWLPCCSRVELCHFTSIPHRLRLLDLPACVQTVRQPWAACFICIANVFSGASWKVIRYPCSMTRWYYEDECWWATRCTLAVTSSLPPFTWLQRGATIMWGYILASTCLPTYLLRHWTGVAISFGTDASDDDQSQS